MINQYIQGFVFFNQIITLYIMNTNISWEENQGEKEDGEEEKRED